MNNKPQRENYDSRKLATDILVRVFENDPWTKWVVKQDGKRRERTTRLFRAIVTMSQKCNQIQFSGAHDGLAIWQPKGRNLTFRDQLALLRQRAHHPPLVTPSWDWKSDPPRFFKLMRMAASSLGTNLTLQIF